MHKTIRLFFEKRDRAKYISHLDITRCFARAIVRSGIPIYYTEGFNPRVYMTFALPLSLGFESGCESMDCRLTDEAFPLEQVAEKLNRTLPQGIRIVETALPEQKPEAIALADYTLRVSVEAPEKLLEDFLAFTQKETILVLKKSKKGEREIDIKPFFTLLESRIEGKQAVLRLRLAAGTSFNISPTLLLEAFHKDTSWRELHWGIERTAILTDNVCPWK